MKRKLFAGAVTAAAVLATLRLIQGSVLSTGPLSAAHADVGCGGCHRAFGSFADDAPCLRCHEKAALPAAERYRRLRCVRCHTEHRGRGFDGAALDESACLGCHRERDLRGGSLTGWATDRPAAPASEHRFHRDHRPAGSTRPPPAPAPPPTGPPPPPPLLAPSASSTNRPGTAVPPPAASLPRLAKPGVPENARCARCHPDTAADHRSASTRHAFRGRPCLACHRAAHHAAPPAGGRL